MTTKTGAWYTPTVKARADLCAALEAKGAEWLRARKLKLSDVQAVVTSGRAAQEADREQQEQLAEQKADRKGRAVNAADVAAREAELAATLPAVIDDLRAAGQVEEARFLAALSFARYRIRVRSVPVTAGEQDEDTQREAKLVERVARGDAASRADGLAALCAALRRPSRPAIQAELAERGFDDATLAALEADATAVAEQGRNAPRALEATAREVEAVQAQRAKWSAIRRLVKRAVQGDRALESLYAAC